MNLIKNIHYFLIILFFIIPFLPSFMVIDRMSVSFLYLSILCVIIQLYYTVTGDKIFSKFFFNKRPLLIVYAFFIIWQLITLSKAFNLTEGIIEFSQYFTLFNAIILISYLGKKISSINYFLLVIVILGSIETLVSFNVFIENYTFENGIQRIRELQGLSSNQNFTSFAILFKIPIVLYFLNYNKNILIKTILSILIFLMIFMLLVLASRASIYGFFIVSLLFILIFLFQKKIFNQPILLRNNLIAFLIISVCAFTLQNFLYKDNKFNVANRIIDLNDNSTSMRLLNYKEAIEGMMNNPLLGVGIGNWKIISLKYAQNRIEDYEVPKHTHNDFLQIGAETGIFGLILFLSIFISVLYKSIFHLFHYEQKSIAILLIVSLIIYSVDSFFNFPRIRPYSQLNFFVITFIYSWLSQREKDEEHTI